MTGTDVAVRAVLWLLAAYHVVIGVASVVSHGTTSRIVARLYAGSLGEGGQLRYAVRMLGFYALAIGALVAVAATDPGAHRPIVAVVAALQAARAISRLLSWRLLADAFAVSRARNALAASMLAAESMVLLLVFA